MAARRTSVPRVPSEVNTNYNTNWLDTLSFKVYYVVALVLLRFILVVTRMENDVAWTVFHIVHCTLTWIGFHWIKGSPIVEEQGKYNRYTFWEQIGHRRSFTDTQKFLTLVPIVVYLLTSFSIQKHALGIDVLNVAALLLVLISKMPGMHLVRLFGINK
eukprot:GILK01003930.1.p1 GENE.GILK01003930.1~~GILK01003930.1.p1  ORF type:complete len:159 (-),score=10.42 GILK01003930.1:138-614(-)